MISWNVIRNLRILSIIILVASMLTNYSQAGAIGLLGLLISYMWSVDKMEDIVKKLDPENKASDKDKADDAPQG